MKKLFAVLVTLIPALYVAGMALFLYIMPEDEVLFAVLGGTVVLSIVLCAFYSVYSKSADKQSLAVTNIWIVAGNLLLFAAELIWLIIQTVRVNIGAQNGELEGGLGIFLLIIFYLPHWISYFVCRCTAAICCQRALRGITGSTTKTIHVLLHLFPVLDLCSAIWVLWKVKHCQSFQ